MNKKYADYVFIIPGNNFSQEVVSSLIQTVAYMYEKQYSYLFLFGYSPIIQSIRNGLLSNFTENGKIENNKIPVDIFNNELECNKIIFIDSDIVWTKEDLKKIIESDKDFIVGTYVLTDTVNSSVREINSEVFMTVNELKNKKEIFEIHSSGLGFMSCSFNAIKNIEYPWFDVEETIVSEGNKKYQKTIGEDIYFFNKIKNAGYKIFADPSIKVGHIKTNILKI
jgi:hypothetical protein